MSDQPAKKGKGSAGQTPVDVRKQKLLQQMQEYSSIPIDLERESRDKGVRDKTVVEPDQSKKIFDRLHTAYGLNNQDQFQDFRASLIQWSVKNGTSVHGSYTDKKNPCEIVVDNIVCDLAYVVEFCEEEKATPHRFLLPWGALGVEFMRSNPQMAKRLAKRRGITDSELIPYAFDFSFNAAMDDGVSPAGLAVLASIADSNFRKSADKAMQNLASPRTPASFGQIQDTSFTPVRGGGGGSGVF